MATITNRVIWADNTDELKSKILSGTDQIVAMKNAVDRTAQSLGGSGLLAAANKVTAAVDQLGGATKLTGSEQDRVNALVTKAIEKYTALGLTAPSAMVALADATKRAEVDTTTFEQKLTAAGSSARTIGAGLTAAITLPILGVGAAALKASIDYETAFAGVKKTISGTPAELAEINTQFRQMALTTPVTAVELAKIGEMAGQLGVQKSKIIEFTKTIVDISVATNLTADEAGSSFARLANVLKMPQTEFSNLGSAVVALGNFGASTEQEMIGMAQRIAAAGSTSGMTAPQVLGIANALSSVGIEAEAGGTAVSKVINKISSDVASGGGKLQVFAKVAGESAEQFSKDWRDNAGLAFSKFMQGLANARESGGEELLGLMDELGFNEVRLRNAFMSAANAGSLMADSIKLGTKAFSENTELARAAEERYKTTANQLKILWNNLTDVAITLGNALTPKLNEAVVAVKPFVSALSDTVKWLLDLPTPVLVAVGAFVGLLAAVGPILVALGGLAFGFVQVTTALTAFTALTGTTVTGMVGAVMASGAMTTALTLAAAAAAVLGAAIGGWMIGRWIAGVLDLDNKIQHLAVSLGMADVAAETAGAKQDSINLARRRGADVTISYTDAIQFNQTWVETHTAALAASTSGHTDQAKAVAGAASGMAAAAARAKQYADDMVKLGDAGKASVIAEHDHGVALKQLATDFGVNEASLDRLVKQHAAAASGIKKHETAAAALHAATVPLTEAQKTQIASLERLKLTDEQVADQVGVNVVKVKQYKEELAGTAEIAMAWEKFHLSIADTARKFIDKWITDTAKAARTVGDALLKAEADRYLSSKDYEEKNYQLTLSGTDLKIRQIERERDTQIRLHGDLNGEASAYYQHQIDLATGTADTLVERMHAAGVATRGDLQITADNAKRDYDQMAADSDLWSQAAIRHQKHVAAEAEAAANGTKTAWDRTYSALGDVSTILSNVPGLVAEIGSVAAKTGQSIMDNLANGNVWGAVIAAATGAIQIISKLWSTFFGTAGRDLVVKFAESLGGFDTLHAKLLTLGSAGEQLWIKLTQGVGRNNPEQAKAVIEEINKALAGQDAWMQRLPGLIEKYGLSWEQAGQQAKQAHLDEIARGLIQDFADLSKAGFDVTTITEHMTVAVNDYISQAMRTGTEIPSAMKPLLQKMIDMGVLTDDAGNKLTNLEGLSFAETLTEGFKSIVDAIRELTQALTGVGSTASTVADVTHRAAKDMVGDWDDVWKAATGAAEGHSPNGIKQVAVRALEAQLATSTATDDMVKGWHDVYVAATAAADAVPGPILDGPGIDRVRGPILDGPGTAGPRIDRVAGPMLDGGPDPLVLAYLASDAKRLADSIDVAIGRFHTLNARVKDLTTSQRGFIDTAMQAGVSVQDIAADLGIGVDAVSAYEQQLKDAAAATQKFEQAQRNALTSVADLIRSTTSGDLAAAVNAAIAKLGKTNIDGSATSAQKDLVATERQLAEAAIQTQLSAVDVVLKGVTKGSAEETAALAKQAALQKQLSTLKRQYQIEDTRAGFKEAVDKLGMLPAEYARNYEKATAAIRAQYADQRDALDLKRKDELALLGPVPVQFNAAYQSAVDAVNQKYDLLGARARESTATQLEALGPVPDAYKTTYTKAFDAVTGKYSALLTALGETPDLDTLATFTAAYEDSYKTTFDSIAARHKAMLDQIAADDLAAAMLKTRVAGPIMDGPGMAGLVPPVTGPVVSDPGLTGSGALPFGGGGSGIPDIGGDIAFGAGGGRPDMGGGIPFGNGDLFPSAPILFGGGGGVPGVKFFADGGVVPFTPRGSDTIPAMLSPGESVLNRRATASLGTQAIGALNRGESRGQVVNFAEMAAELRSMRQAQAAVADAQARRDASFATTLARAVRDEMQKAWRR